MPEVKNILIAVELHKQHAVPVVRNGKLVGIIARADILSRMIEPEFVTVFGGQVQ